MGFCFVIIARLVELASKIKKHCSLFMYLLMDKCSCSSSLLHPPRVAELTSLPPRRAAAPFTLSDATAYQSCQWD